MVSRIYSPYTPVYSPNPAKKAGTEHDAEKDPFKDGAHKDPNGLNQELLEEQQARQKATITHSRAETTTPVSGGMTGPLQTQEQAVPFEQLAPDGPAMATIQEQANQQQINITTILKDFQSTANALGIDATLQDEVAGYINVIQSQAAKESPSVPYIKHTLSTASVSLDNFISKTLGQPSSVVKDWIDALFLQDINFKASPNAEGTFQIASNTTTSLTDPVALKDLWHQAKTAFKEGDSLTALNHLENGLSTINHVDQPDLAGRFHYRAAKIYEGQGRLGDAQAHYQAITQLQDTDKLNMQKADSYLALAHFGERTPIADSNGEPINVASYYRQAGHYAEQAHDYQTKAFSENSLAHYQLNQGNIGAAINTLSQSIKSAQQHIPHEAALLSDLYTNLGHAAQQQADIKIAARSYKMAIQYAERANEQTLWAQGIHTLANLYSEANLPTKASETIALLSQTI